MGSVTILEHRLLVLLDAAHRRVDLGLHRLQLAGVGDRAVVEPDPFGVAAFDQDVGLAFELALFRGDPLQLDPPPVR
jgi:hypothetical protein